jgi:hypothetical protein
MTKSLGNQFKFFGIANLTTFSCADRISSVTASPYRFIVVRMSECRINFCCTPIGVPTESSRLFEVMGAFWFVVRF